MINLINAQVDISPNETITMIGPMYNSDDFPDFLTWDSEEGASIYYADAFRFCAQLVYEGHEDWRLPTVSAIHNHVQENPESEFIIPNHDTTGWGSFWTSAMHDNPSAAITANTMLAYIVPLINISGSNHQTLPNQILFYAAENSYNMSNCFCVR